MKEMEKRLEEKIGTILRTGMRRPSVQNANDLNRSSSPMQQTLDRNVMEVQSAVQQTRYMLR
jgi:hypothetical protein